MICEKIEGLSGEIFVPEMVAAFKSLAKEESFWFDIVSPSIDSLLVQKTTMKMVGLDLDKIISLSSLFSKLIDYRSKFTATHSSGVAAVAKALARMVGFSERECSMIEIAGNLHDLGKLAVPTEILEKVTSLTYEEMNIIRKHTYYTYHILKRIHALGSIVEWASFHHESLDGHGYPFKIKNGRLSLGSRILAIADVFSAITEDRPYRKGITRDKVLTVFQRMVDDNKLDSRVVSVLKANFDEINSVRSTAQADSVEKYEQVMHNNV